MTELYALLNEELRANYNSNFQLGKLDWITQVIINRLCYVLDKKLAEELGSIKNEIRRIEHENAAGVERSNG
jgi:hypothetical protein